MGKVSIAEKPQLIKNPILLNGITRTGKFFVGRIISCSKNLEYFQYVSILDYLPYMERLGFINKDCAVSLLRANIDQHAYNMRIGRNLNCRLDDISNINNSYESDKYIKRSLTPINKELISNIKKRTRLPIFILHECLPNIKIYYDAFPFFKWINLIRHPVDVIHSWYLRGYGHRYQSDPLFFSIRIKGVNGPIPWHAYKWKKEYETMSEMDRIIKTIYSITSMGKESYAGLHKLEKKKIIFICYEKMVTDPMNEIGRISRFLNTKPTKHLPNILSEERCPRVLISDEREKKYKDISRKATTKAMKLLKKLITDYENNKYHGYPL